MATRRCGLNNFCALRALAGELELRRRAETPSSESGGVTRQKMETHEPYSFARSKYGKDVRCHRW
jgi:hypothetical protein